MKRFTNKIMSLDVETNGLWGKPVSIGFTLEEDGVVTFKAEAAFLKDIVPVNDWVAENVINPLKKRDDVVQMTSYEELLKWFADQYMSCKNEYTVVYHMGHVVESYLFRELVDHKMIGEFDAPYTPIELSMLLMAAGFAPDSVDALVKEGLIEAPAKSSVHQALYDAEVAGRAYWYLVDKLSK